MPRNKKLEVAPESLAIEALSEMDLNKMLLNQARVGLAQVRAQMAKQALAHAAIAGELQATRLEAQTNRNLQTARGMEQAAQDALEAASAASRILAADVAERYSVDWHTASFDPDTGAIMRLPRET